MREGETGDDQIVVDRLEDADRRLLQSVDYIVSGGDVIRPVWKGYSLEMHLEVTDEIPDEYWSRYHE